MQEIEKSEEAKSSRLTAWVPTWSTLTKVTEFSGPKTFYGILYLVPAIAVVLNYVNDIASTMGFEATLTVPVGLLLAYVSTMFLIISSSLHYLFCPKELSSSRQQRTNEIKENANDILGIIKSVSAIKKVISENLRREINDATLPKEVKKLFYSETIKHLDATNIDEIYLRFRTTILPDISALENNRAFTRILVSLFLMIAWSLFAGNIVRLIFVVVRNVV